MAAPAGAQDGRSQPLNFKIVLLGEGAVGKTSLVLRYVDNKFNEKHISTLQVFQSEILLVFSSSLVLYNNQ